MLKTILILSISSFYLLTASANEDMKSQNKTAEQLAEEERCTVPAFAKAIGHEELWKKHNGCATEDGKKDE